MLRSLKIFVVCSQRSDLEQQLADSQAMCSIKQRELEAKNELIAQAKQLLLQKDQLIQQEKKRLEDANIRRAKCATVFPFSPPPTPPSMLAPNLPSSVKDKLQQLRMRSMEFDDSPVLSVSASPSSPNSFCGRSSPVTNALMGNNPKPAQDVTPRAAMESGSGLGHASYRSGLFEVSKDTFSSARVQTLGSSQ
jgi:hypothetical protein